MLEMILAVSDFQLLTEYECRLPLHSSKTAAYRSLAALYDLNLDSVRSRVNRARKRQQKQTPKAEPATKQSAPRFYVLPKSARNDTPDDTERWQDELSRLRAREGFITVAHLADIHFPYQNDTALNLAYRLVERKQPHVIVVGSDTADFALISKFAPDPDANEAIDDELDELRRYWSPHIDTLKRIAAKAVLVFVMGNHEDRIYRHMEDNAPKLRRTVERAWIDLVTQRGQVLWLGRRQHVDIGPLVVAHGDRFNEHVAKSLLMDHWFQVSVMAGHVHRLNRYDTAGYRYPVTGVTSGCLCELQPHYLRGKRNHRPWQHGTAFATVDLKGTDVFIDNLEFRAIAGELVTISDGDVVRQTA